MEQSDVPTQVVNNTHSLKNSESNFEWIASLLILPIVGILITTLYLQVNKSTPKVNGVNHTQTAK